jgi:hypothetical protein
MEFEGSWPCSQQSTTGPYPEPRGSSIIITPSFLKKVLILSVRLCLCLSRVSSLVVFWLKYFINFSSVHVPAISSSSHLPFFDHSICWSVQTMKLCSFIRPSVTSALIRPNILSLLSCRVRDQVSKPYKHQVKFNLYDLRFSRRWVRRWLSSGL